MQEIKLGIIGSRGFDDYQDFRKRLYAILGFASSVKIIEVISGGAKGGIDSLAKRFAEDNCFHLTEYLTNYKVYGSSAPLKNNKTIVDNSDMIIAFWDGKSKDIVTAINRAEAQDKIVFIERVSNPS